jgi:Acyl-CoA reductase (LuxC)
VIATPASTLTVQPGVFRLPALVKGELLMPPAISIETLRTASGDARLPMGASQWLRLDETQVLRQSVVDRTSLIPTDQDQFLLLPYVNPRALIETDLESLHRELYRLPFDEVLAYIGALRDVLCRDTSLVTDVAAYTKARSPVDDRALDLMLEILPQLLDPGQLADWVDRELGDGVASGRHYLDEWVAVPARVHRGPTARMGDDVHRRVLRDQPLDQRPCVHAIPTRQLHITAGNSPVVPFVSLLRSLVTKGATVLKSPAESMAGANLLARAMHKVDSKHPLTRHTSLVYWKGGDRRMEDVLLAPGAFDRIVIWGSAETMTSVAGRMGSTRAVYFKPRYGVSLIGSEVLPGMVEHVAARAATDALIANQAACMASLVHYVEGSESEVLDYCRALREALARWDRALPHHPTRTSASRLRHWRRGQMVHGTWFENGVWPHTTSAVVYMPTPFDLAAHPMSRCVVVRRVEHLRDALPYVQAGVATVGVYPEARRLDLRDELAARGVSNVLPLGEGERAYAGMPHDGMRVLSELVNWANA